MRPAIARVLCQLARFNSASIRVVHTTPKMAEEYVEQLKKENPYYSKYAEKIKKLQETSGEDLERRVQEKKQTDKVAEDSRAVRSFSVAEPKSTAVQTSAAKPKVLADVIKMELIQDRSGEEVGQLWTEFYKTKDSVSAVIPAEQYQDVAANMMKYPTFLFPLPRDQGYEFVMVQFAGNEAHFTSLINYQAYKENAPECMAMVHYPELAEQKGVVLMAAEYDSTVLVGGRRCRDGPRPLWPHASANSRPAGDNTMQHLSVTAPARRSFSPTRCSSTTAGRTSGGARCSRASPPGRTPSGTRT